VPLRPSKLRLNDRTEIAPLAGAWPMPMQGPHPASRMRAPAETRSASAPLRAIMLRVCLLPGVTVSDTLGCTVLPLSMAAMVSRSTREELVQLPTHTWLTGVPTTSRTGTTRSGL